MSNERADQTKRCIPGIFEIGKDCLYIGADCDSAQFVPELVNHNYKITLLEIWRSNCDFYFGHPWFRETICSDIRVFDADHLKWDLSIWLHGPEHIHKEEFEPTIRKIEKLTRKLIVMACPWGIYPEGPVHGNPNQVHVSSLYEEDFKALGYMVDTIGQKDVPGSNLLSWKYMETIK